jgi:L-lactate utilization protein LutC
MSFDTLPSQFVIDGTIAALRNNNIEAFLVNDKEEAARKVMELLPEGSEVMNMTSVTLDQIGISKEVQESGSFRSVRNELQKMDRKTEAQEMQKLGSAPAWVIGSVHAVTQDGHVLVASKTGSQIPAYAYGAGRVVWIVGAQKIVKDIDAGMRRIYEHTLPLESERAKAAYGVAGSSVNKMLIFNREATPGRVTMILVNEVLGY